MTALLLEPAPARAAHPADRPAVCPDDADRQRAIQTVERTIGDIGRVPVLWADDPRVPTADTKKITGDELAVLIGAEAARYALVRQARNPAAPIDIERWRRRTADNPLFCVQFAHSRLAASSRYAADRAAAGIRTTARAGALPPDDQTAATARSAVLRRVTAEYPRVLANTVQRQQPHRLTRYLERLAVAAGAYLTATAAVPDAGRLGPAVAARQVLAHGLTVLGVSAPERM